MMHRTPLATLALALAAAVATPAAACGKAQPGPRARAAAILQLTAAAAAAPDAALARELARETEALGAALADDPAARESFRAFRLRVPAEFRPALEPAIDRMVEALAGAADPMEARRIAGESFPDRAPAPFEPATAEALRGWLVGMRWLPAGDARDLTTFIEGMKRKGTFLFSWDGCYENGHTHHGCDCQYHLTSGWIGEVDEDGLAYTAKRGAQLFGRFTETFSSEGISYNYTLTPAPGASFPADKLKTRIWRLNHTLAGDLTEASIAIHTSAGWTSRPLNLTVAIRAMAEREKRYWNEYFIDHRMGARTAGRHHFIARPACPECGSLEKETVNCVVPGEEPCFCARCGYAFE